MTLVKDQYSPVYKELNKRVQKVIQKDLRTYNMKFIEEIIEDNMNMRVLRKNK